MASEPIYKPHVGPRISPLQKEAEFSTYRWRATRGSALSWDNEVSKLVGLRPTPMEES